MTLTIKTIEKTAIEKELDRVLNQFEWALYNIPECKAMAKDMYLSQFNSRVNNGMTSEEKEYLSSDYIAKRYYL